MALGLEWKVIWASIVRLFLNLVALVIFVPKYATMGAVIAINISFFGYWVTTLVLYKRSGLRPVKNLFKYFMFAAIILFSGWAINSWVSGELLGVAIFFVISFIFSLIIYYVPRGSTTPK